MTIDLYYTTVKKFIRIKGIKLLADSINSTYSVEFLQDDTLVVKDVWLLTDIYKELLPYKTINKNGTTHDYAAYKNVPLNLIKDILPNFISDDDYAQFKRLTCESIETESLLSTEEAALALYEGKAIKANWWSTDFIYFEADTYDKNIIKLLNSKSKTLFEFNWDFYGFSKKENFCKKISELLEYEYIDCKNESEKCWEIAENCDKKSNIHLLTNKENSNLQAKEEKMKTTLSTQVVQVKSDAQNAIWRNSASCAVQMVKVPFLNVLTTYCNNSFVLSVVKEKLETKEGEAVLSYVLGTVLPLVPKVSSNKDLLRLSEEMRIKGFETLFAEVFSKVLVPLLEPLQKALSLMKESMPEEE